MATDNDADKDPKKKGSDDDDILAEAREEFERSSDAADENRVNFIDDKKFARLGEQWPKRIVQDRQREGRPCLTINRMPAFTRQVVNDARQNKPSIKVHPVDSGSDPQTAKIFDGLIRNIEYTSSADVAYDTAIENSVDGGFGYWRIGLDYTCDDTFDLDITIDRVADPLLIYPDENSTAADSSDWNKAFVVEHLTTDEFEKKYPKAEKVNWEEDFGALSQPWFEDNNVMVAEWWTREKVTRQIVLMSDGSVLSLEKIEEDQDLKDYLNANGITPVKERAAESYKVTQRILTGAEVLETNEWPGKFIPIVPVYGDEVWVDGKRYLRSLIRDAKDPQRMFNFWRTATTELVALSPRAPFIGPKGAFKTDLTKWETANSTSHAFLEFDGQIRPERQPFNGVPAGALQEALNASDDMKSAMGIFDASLGARSNETSGKAILARQREGDVGTFHFADNLNRAVRHSGRILLDLIPKVYNERRMVRVLGQDGTPSHVPLGQPVQMMTKQGEPAMGQDGLPVTKIFDLTAGKYDLSVEAGPSFTTRREEAAQQMMAMIQAFPQSAPVIGPLLAKNLDWPGADEVADRLDQLWQQMQGAHGQQQGGVPPELAQQFAKMQQALQQMQTENQQLLLENSSLKQGHDIKAADVQVKTFEAQTDRMRAVHEFTKPEIVKTA